MELKTTLQFLNELNKNNNKEWFDANRSRYKDIRVELLAYINDFISDISKFDESLAGVESKKCIFRINRDI